MGKALGGPTEAGVGRGNDPGWEGPSFTAAGGGQEEANAG